MERKENYNEANLTDWHQYIANDSAQNKRKVYTLVQVNKPCKVVVTEKNQKKLAKVILG